MRTDTTLAMMNMLKRDYSEESQLKQFGTVRQLLKINQDVIVHGIAVLEEYVRDTAFSPLLCKGLKLVWAGIEPRVTEAVLVNTALANDMDLLESLLITEGVISIQTANPPGITTELLLSYFTFDIQEQLEKSLEELRIKRTYPLSAEEVKQLLNSQ